MFRVVAARFSSSSRAPLHVSASCRCTIVVVTAFVIAAAVSVAIVAIGDIVIVRIGGVIVSVFVFSVVISFLLFFGWFSISLEMKSLSLFLVVVLLALYTAARLKMRGQRRLVFRRVNSKRLVDLSTKCPPCTVRWHMPLSKGRY